MMPLILFTMIYISNSTMLLYFNLIMHDVYLQVTFPVFGLVFLEFIPMVLEISPMHLHNSWHFSFSNSSTSFSAANKLHDSLYIV